MPSGRLGWTARLLLRGLNPSCREGLAQPLPPRLRRGAPHPTSPAILRALRAGPQPRLLSALCARRLMSVAAHRVDQFFQQLVRRREDARRSLEGALEL